VLDPGCDIHGLAANRTAGLTRHDAATIRRLLQLRLGAHLQLVGDIDQLPSVGASGGQCPFFMARRLSQLPGRLPGLAARKRC